MCSFRIVDGDSSAVALKKSIKAGKLIEEQMKQRALEKFYEEVKNNENII